ncbi:MAG: hypothetical protein OXE59_02925 [Bacteroidetes bacterium]|nr:hypothetical protein [Bacteroidota bacterium]
MDAWTKKRHQFKRVTQPLTELELLLKNAFDDHFPTAKVELIRIREPLVFEENDHLDIAFVYSFKKDLNYNRRHKFFWLVESKLLEMNEERFPSISYIEYDDYMENTPKELLS